MISDEAALAGDGTLANRALVTDQSVPGVTALPASEITIAGLSTGAITYGAASTGNFADGITVWTGWGDDFIRVDGTHDRPGVRTITTLNTGLGNDNVLVDLDTGDDGFFVLNTQGPYNPYLTLSDADIVDASLSTLPLVIFGGQGRDNITGGSAQDVIFGDRGRVQYSDSGGQVVTVLGNGGPGDRTDGVIRPPSAIFTVDPTIGSNDRVSGGPGRDLIFGGGNDDVAGDKNRESLFGDSDNDLIVGDYGRVALTGGLPVLVESTDRDRGGNDIVSGGTGEDVLIGGATADRIDGDAGDDLIFGDNVRLDRVTSDFRSLRFQVLNGILLYNAQGNADVTSAPQLDPAGSPDWADWRITLLDHSLAVQTANDNTFGNDQIAGGADDDMIFGQLGDDVIQGDGATSANVSTTNPISSEDLGGAGTDGDDYVEGGGGNDLILGNLGQDDLIGGSSDLFGLTTPAMRPDGSDTIYGGAGTRVARNDTGISSANAHSRDSDMILGDNGRILRVVGTNGAAAGHYLSFNYDNYSGATLRIIPRAIALLDYTPGTGAASDIGAGDIIRGESGDDFIHGATGNDVLFGDGQDDDIFGEAGADWISGGTGDDGVLGDDGKLLTSRNGFAEPLNGVAAIPAEELDLTLRTPGGMQTAVTNISGRLKKTTDIEPFELGGNDIIYGGLGNDSLHGGAGDDAISGAEALPAFYSAALNPGNVLNFGARDPNEFAAYDEVRPMVKIVNFLLNFEATDAAGNKVSDGEDVLFGDVGNDWLVGGTNSDHLYGGLGSDLMNADDNLETHGAVNDQPDAPLYADSDTAYGGGGRDVLIANTGADRLIDWSGEFNSYLVPFSPFGAPTISRGIPPQLMEYLYDLSKSDGADQTRVGAGLGTADRNGEPFGEIGLVNQQDPAWQDQHGKPDDPQPGNTQGKRDVRVQTAFEANTPMLFANESGSAKVSNGRYELSPVNSGQTVSLIYLQDDLPKYFEISTVINANNTKQGFKSNAYIVFDYHSETDFKFAGVDIGLNKVQIGQRTTAGWTVLAEANSQVVANRDQTFKLIADRGAVSLEINGAPALSFTFADVVNSGLAGVATNNAITRFDDFTVYVLPPPITLGIQQNFNSGLGVQPNSQIGLWQLNGGRYLAAPDSGSDTALTTWSTNLPSTATLQLQVLVNTSSYGGLLFDYSDAINFKFAALLAGTRQVGLGHLDASGWHLDSLINYSVTAGTDYTLGVSIRGATVSVSVNGQSLLNSTYSESLLDGNAGLFTLKGTTAFDDLSITAFGP